MNPLGFALAGAVLFTSSLFAFDTLGQAAAPAAQGVERTEVRAPAVQAIATGSPAVAEVRRPVRVILSSPYDRQR